MGMKRANGTGSVYKLKQKLRKPFKAVITVGWKDDGTRIRKCIGYFEKSAEAYQALAAYQLEPERFDNRDVTFAQAWDWMITDKKKKRRRLEKGRLCNGQEKVCAHMEHADPADTVGTFAGDFRFLQKSRPGIA